MIQESKVTKYTPICDTCGWHGLSSLRDREFAERQLKHHDCNEHRQVYDDRGGFRWWWGDRQQRKCICGETWFVDDSSLPFVCPKVAAGIIV